uniref:Eukaryotic translation initiation factor 2A n=1 Tax=Kalanchoe fedtschenkoi TaxID=63787 RepID=A0A7N0UN35_KALFE
MAASPPLEILIRGPQGFSIWGGPPFSNAQQPTINLDAVPCSTAVFSEDGARLMVIQSDSRIALYDCATNKEIKVIQVPNLVAAALSPAGNYLQTFQKPTTPQEKNVTLWNIEAAAPLYQHFQKNMTKATWPLIRFSSDEVTACRLATNEIQFFDSKDFSKGIVNRLRIQGVAAMEISKSPGSYVAAFVPETKGVPASVQIFSSNKDQQSQPVTRRSFFQCSSVQLSWNHGSTGLLVLVQSDVDKTNKSYYGVTKLNYLTIDGTHTGLVPLSKEGPVHDVQWSYSGKEFAVVYGFMPAKVTIFDQKCNVLLELGIGPYNTVRWNPKGKFICVAGFGNLPGDMAFWDYAEKKKLATTKAEWSVTSEWSPDGCYFMTATTAPRLQVDNGIKIFLHDGSLYFKKMFDKLFQAEWKPHSPDKFGEISNLEQALGSITIDEPKPKGQGSKSSQNNAKSSSLNPPSQKPTAYRPPQAKAAAAVQAQLLGSTSSEEMSKAALRNKKKREKQKEKKAAEAGSAGNGST